MKIKYKTSIDGENALTPCPFNLSILNHGKKRKVMVGSIQCLDYCKAISHDGSARIVDCGYNKK